MFLWYVALNRLLLPRRSSNGIEGVLRILDITSVYISVCKWINGYFNAARTNVNGTFKGLFKIKAFDIVVGTILTLHEYKGTLQDITQREYDK